MIELKKVVILDGEIVNIGEIEFLPPSVTVEEREMVFTLEHGWREIGWIPEPTFEEKVQADLKYLSIMSGAEL